MTQQEKDLKLEDRITHMLSEWLNDMAPIGESAYRAPAKAVIAEIKKELAVNEKPKRKTKARS